MDADTETLTARLEAVERALTDGDEDPAAAGGSTAGDRRLDSVETTLADLEDRVTDLEAAVQSLRGFLGDVKSVDDEVARRANAALARVESLESERSGPGRESAAERSAGDLRTSAGLRSERETQAGRAVAEARGEAPTEAEGGGMHGGRAAGPTDAETGAPETTAPPPVEVARRALDEAAPATGGRGGLDVPDGTGAPDSSGERREPTASAARAQATDGGSDAVGSDERDGSVDSVGGGTVEDGSASTADGGGRGLVARLRGVL